ncbi:MAG: ABC transporter ATP-binding protein [Burkholderiales bacterium]|nr:ABC transporter ATP-binding protein [Burkholderiales bacterium]
MSSPLIITRELAKSYELGGLSVQALRGVSLAIGSGEFVAVMGPSGSGKSTFMNLLGCLDTPSSGEYLLAGERVSGLDGDALAAIRNRRIGFVFQSFNLLARTSALENIALPLLYCGVPAAERERRAAARLAEVGLAERGHHHPAQLSGGQQQRVAIARALVNDPVLILADEPTGALDTLTSCEVMALLQQLNRGGMTVVLVTHERDIAEFAQRVVTFRDGRVVEDQRIAEPKDAAAMAAQLRAGAGVNP